MRREQNRNAQRRHKEKVSQGKPESAEVSQGKPIQKKKNSEKKIKNNSCGDKPPRARNPLMDALAECDGDPLQIPPSAWGRIAKALSEIKAVCPNVTPEEIKRRSYNYKNQFGETISLTSTALVKHWARCDGIDKNQSTRTPVKPSKLTSDENTTLIAWRNVVPQRELTDKTDEDRKTTADMKSRLQELEAKAAQ